MSDEAIPNSAKEIASGWVSIRPSQRTLRATRPSATRNDENLQSQFFGTDNDLGTIAHPQLLQDIVNVPFRSPYADDQYIGNILIGLTRR